MTCNIPNQNNLYATISGIESKKALADLLGANGWNIRKSTWTDFEARTEWAELVIEGEEGDILINGAIDLAMYNRLESLLSSFRIKGSVELYNEEGILIREQKFENIGRS